MSNLHIPQYSRQLRLKSRINKILENDILGAVVMLAAAVIALILANTALQPAIQGFLDSYISVGIGGATAEMSVLHFVNDILMAVFFLMIGIELKYEFTVGELSEPRNAILPIMAAVGGAAMPIVIYMAFNTFLPGGDTDGWAIPVATDIAFALGVLSLLGKRVPTSLRTFFATFAIADDIMAILIIAFFYSSGLSFFWLGVSAVIVIVLFLLNRAHVYSLTPYIVLGLVLLATVFMSGVHATIAGVVLAFTLPTKTQFDPQAAIAWLGDRVGETSKVFDTERPILSQSDYLHESETISAVARYSVPPIIRLEHMLDRFSTYFVLPVFAFSNSLIPLGGLSVGEVVTSPIALGVALGLVIGKPVGSMLMSFVLVKAKIAPLPRDVTWSALIGVGLLAGIGFTMAILIAGLSFADPRSEMISKIAILVGSLMAGIIGFLFIRFGQHKVYEDEEA